MARLSSLRHSGLDGVSKGRRGDAQMSAPARSKAVNGLRYREALDTTDKREAKELEKKRVAEIHQGKGASKSGRDFARKPFSEAAAHYLEERRGHVAERTLQFEQERLRPLIRFFNGKPLLRIKAEDVAAYQRERRANGDSGEGISNRTINMETGVLRRILKRAKRWNALAEDVKFFPERHRVVGRVLTADQKKLLFETAGLGEDWLVAFCAASLAVTTSARGVELKHLRWADVDLFNQEMHIRRSKTESGHRTIPLVADAMTAFARLRDRAEKLGSDGPDHYVFPACERFQIDPLKPQRSWRTAWRSLTKKAAERSGAEAAELAVQEGRDPETARASGEAVFAGLRFHDLRHQAVTELAESGASDTTIMSIAGHLSRAMMEHYSHTRKQAKKEALAALSTGLNTRPTQQTEILSNKIN